MTTTIRTSEPRELLALVPFQLGFQPQESAVVISVRAHRSRVGMVARVDLADLSCPVRGPEVARALVAHLVADGARSVVLVVYTAADLRGTDAATATSLVRNVARATEGVLDGPSTWVVTPGGWYGLDCSDDTCCPPGGRPHAELESTAVGAEMVLRGAAVAPSREGLGAVGDASAPARRSARRAAVRWADRARAAASPSELHRWRHAGLVEWRSCLEAARAGRPETRPTVLGRLRASLDDVLVRDAVLLLVVPCEEDLPDRVVAGDAGADVGDALRALVDPAGGVPPDGETCRAVGGVLAGVAAHTTGGRHAPSLTLLAVLAWWSGDGARAAVLLERALEAEPAYRLARLVEEAVVAGMPPGWLARGRV
ncbi:DUF4192 domain-containing protein [Actinotalea sp. AC32]|nr:DUF4192 domain-containing protein [Actinotalea sp. AC32]